MTSPIENLHFPGLISPELWQEKSCPPGFPIILGSSFKWDHFRPILWKLNRPHLSNFWSYYFSQILEVTMIKKPSNWISISSLFHQFVMLREVLIFDVFRRPGQKINQVPFSGSWPYCWFGCCLCTVRRNHWRFFSFYLGCLLCTM